MGNAERLHIDFLGNRVGGIARPEDRPAVFVRGALPGEEVLVEYTSSKKSYSEARIISVEKPSPHRIDPFCPLYGRCGGCSLQHIEYSEELRWKREWVSKALRSLDSPEVEEVIPSPLTRGYRNRVTFDLVEGQLTLHAFRGDPLPVDSCPLMNGGARKALSGIDPCSIPEGVSRISARGGEHTGDSALEYFSGGRWIRKGELRERLNGLLYEVPAGGFFQVNTLSAELLVDMVMGMIPPGSGKALDLYGGAGTFSVPMALSGIEVDSVEMNREASAACGKAALLNGVSEGGLTAHRSRDRNFLSEAIRESAKYDVIVTDPPRAGMGIRITRQLRRIAPEAIIYVSCNPFASARDISVLLEGGYRIARVAPVDLFPRTDHVETVFLLEGKTL